MEKFIGKFDIQASLDGICEVLKIAEIKMQKDDPTKNLDDRTGFLRGAEEISYYCVDDKHPESESIVDKNRMYVVKESAKLVVPSKYTFYQRIGSEDWTDEDKVCLKTIANLLYTYVSHSAVLNYVEYGKNHDMRFRQVHNLAYAIEFLEKILESENKNDYTVVCFNIHNFAKVNKSLGKEISSYCLEQYFEELKKIIGMDGGKEGETGVVAAVESDNGFLVYNNDLQIHMLSFFSETEIDYSECEKYKNTEKIENDGKILLSAHIGIVTDLEEFSSANDVLEAGKAALAVSRKMTGSKLVFYDEDFKKKFGLQKQIEDWFMDALRNEEFLVYYQPKIDLHDYSLKGAESLVRWVHNTELIFPDNFIPALENNYTIKYLDMYMLNHVCEDISNWLKEGKKVPQISVNLSRATLTIPNLKELIVSTIKKHNIPLSLIQIELTESASYTSNDELKPLVFGLNEAGISTAVDDFGTGFSSLSLIRELPWDMLKIDKSLLNGIQNKGGREEKMFRSIISMAKDLGLKCIVEGVETREDVRILKENGCFFAQGYYFSKPIPKADFEKKISHP